MWVGEGGDMLGAVTIGGCVDAYVIEQAEAVLATQMPCLIELPLGDEDAWELGLSCAGTIEVFIEPLSATHSHVFDLYTALKSHLDSGAAGALLTCLDGASMGAKLLLLDNGHTLGSLGDLELDRLSLFEALEPFRLDGGVVNEDVLAPVLADEAVALGVVEPLHASRPSHVDLLLGMGRQPSTRFSELSRRAAVAIFPAGP